MVKLAPVGENLTVMSLSVPIAETPEQRAARESEWKRQQRPMLLGQTHGRGTHTSENLKMTVRSIVSVHLVLVLVVASISGCDRAM